MDQFWVELDNECTYEEGINETVDQTMEMEVDRNAPFLQGPSAGPGMLGDDDESSSDGEKKNLKMMMKRARLQMRMLMTVIPMMMKIAMKRAGVAKRAKTKRALRRKSHVRTGVFLKMFVTEKLDHS